MSNLIQMALVAMSAIMVYEIVQTTVVYLLRNKLKRALNIFLGRQVDLDLSGYAFRSELQDLKDRFNLAAQNVDSNSEATEKAIHEVLKGVRNLTRLSEGTKKLAEDNAEAIKKLKLTKANTSTVKKLQKPKTKTKAVTVKRTSKRPAKKRG